MFDKKLDSLFEVPVKKGTNSFVEDALKESSKTLSGNSALKFSTTGNDFVDQFGSVGQFLKPRDFKEIQKDMSLLFFQDREMAIRFTLYLRLISRKCLLFDGTKTENVQKGAGLKYESIMRMIWLSQNDSKAFWSNIQLFIACGSWKDIFEMMRIDLEYHGFENRVLDWDKLTNLIMAGLENGNTSELVKKYLPQIKSRSNCNTLRKQCNTVIGKFLCNKIFGSKQYKKYRELKSSGKAHVWQQLISKRLYDEIDFDTIHGRALSSLVSSKFLSNHNLEKTYEKWIESKPVAKFTGYVHELSKDISHFMKPYKKMTVNKQYKGLVELAKDGVNTNSSLIVVRDTSSSMKSVAKGTNISSYDIAKALGIFFGDMLQGEFTNSWIEFRNKAVMHTYKTKTFVDKWIEDRGNCIGNTDFQSVIDLFINLKRRGIDESEFPTGIICISDGEFDRVGGINTTNHERALTKLRNGGFSKEYVDNFKMIFWDIPNNYYRNTSTKFETFGETENLFYLSGYDGSILSFLLGGKDEVNEITPKTDVELFKSAMSQEILGMVQV